MSSIAVRLFSAVAIMWLLFSPTAQAVCQDGCLTNNNTVLGEDALLNNAGFDNTAIGFTALRFNTTGTENTAVGFDALLANNTGSNNTAIGFEALVSNTDGIFNTANGSEALSSNISGGSNTASGNVALFSNTNGSGNTASGAAALYYNTTGNNNTAVGFQALNGNTGNSNTALGYLAGFNVTTGDNNIEIGNTGQSNDLAVIRIGTKGTQRKAFIAGINGVTTTNGVAVYINSSGQLGTVTSSMRFKDKIHDIRDASDVLLSLRPVEFRYKAEIDPERIPQFGLVAEEVEKVDPDLVVRDSDGQPYTVRYDAVNAMLLNEFLKEHRKVEEQGKTISELRSTIAQQAKGMEALAAQVKEQSAQIQRVSAQLATTNARGQLVENP
jgi:uncharacterized coiled-coil protein SlyX